MAEFGSLLFLYLQNSQWQQSEEFIHIHRAKDSTRDNFCTSETLFPTIKNGKKSEILCIFGRSLRKEVWKAQSSHCGHVPWKKENSLSLATHSPKEPWVMSGPCWRGKTHYWYQLVRKGKWLEGTVPYFHVPVGKDIDENNKWGIFLKIHLISQQNTLVCLFPVDLQLCIGTPMFYEG